MDLKKVMQRVIEEGSPDLHLQVGQPPVMRLKTGALSPVDSEALLTEADIRQVIDKITNQDQRQRLSDQLELDFSFEIPGLSRFRANVFQERRGPSIAFRVISEKIPTFDELMLPEVVKKLAALPHGLVLITGPAGSGKSTSLASIVDYISSVRKCHIITIEDPIEYVFKNKQALITQREVNIHTHNFPNAIRSALRQDPDVVMVGEMRDLETIAAAITLAETGHLVLSTLHTQDAAQTVDRMINVFPAYQQQQIRAQLADTLKGVICQLLIPRADGQGRVAAREIMISNDAIRNCISKGETHQIYSMIQLNAQEGMQLMDQSLMRLLNDGLITTEEARAKATDIDLFKI